jgi:membrane fusion protein, copper/silver efflux system
MSSHDSPGRPEPLAPEVAAPAAPPLSRWQKFRLVVKVVELRLRFIALMAITGLIFAYWDTLWNRYDKWMQPPTHQHAVVSGTEFYCPMHPQVVRDEPGTCPICGMPLTKRKKGEKEKLPEGVTARVQLAPFRIQQAGIKTAEVAYTPLTETLSTVGFVEFDERRLAHISSKVRGMSRVEKLYVNFTGIDVAAGETLAELYSPELYQAIQELLLARRSAQQAPRMQSALGRSVLGDPQELTRMAIEKLKLWGITQAQVDAILKQGKADFKVPIISPISGHVLKKNIVEGQYVQEGEAMFEIADLHTVWVKARIYEDEVGLVHVGQAVEATVEAFPGRTFPGKVAFVQPHLDPATRTIEVRYDLDNPGHQLRPGMYATVTLKTPVAETPMFQTRRVALRPAGDAVRRTSLTAAEQKVCPVTGAALGSMGDPVPVEVNGQKVWVCCDACPPKLKANPGKYLAKLAPPAAAAAEAPTVEEQKVCPVTGAKLGSMGDPVLVEVEGRKVWTCCPACPPKLKADPARYLARLAPAPQDAVLTVPESAVIDTGKDKLVYVEAEPGVFEGRKVVLGPRSGDLFPVLEGLAPGEKVAATGTFLIDAESRINPATRGNGPESGSPPPPVSTPAAPPRSASAAAENAHR